MRWLDGITNSVDKFEETQEDSDGWTEKPGMLQFMGLQRVRHDSVTEQQ